MEKQTATAIGRNLPVSTKHTVEICNFIKGRALDQAVMLLESVSSRKVAIPMKRYNKDTGHKKGNIAAGRFPEKACGHVLKILKNGEANASNKGLVTPYIIEEIRAASGPKNWKMSRHRGRKGKSTHVYLTIAESSKKEEKKTEAPKKAEKKVEAKPVEEKKVETKPVEEKKVETKKSEDKKVETKKSEDKKE